MKRIKGLLAAVLLLCFCGAGCTPMGRAHSAARIINQDLQGITSLAEKILETGSVPEDAYYAGVERIGYVAPDWVEFRTGSRGLVPSAAYCGFYYSPEDQPMGYQGADMELTEDGSGWAWEEAGGDNSYYTERIQFGWFYYEMYF